VRHRTTPAAGEDHRERERNGGKQAPSELETVFSETTQPRRLKKGDSYDGEPRFDGGLVARGGGGGGHYGADKSSINEAVPLKLAAHEVRRISDDEWEDESELDDRDERDGTGASPQSPIPPGREGVVPRRKKPGPRAAAADDFVNPMHNGRAHSNALFRFDED
jgi:hypothetical protein